MVGVPLIVDVAPEGTNPRPAGSAPTLMDQL
jgi:hypothetical protein